MNIIEKLASEGYLTPEQVERIGRNVAEVVKAAQKDPSILKEAGFFDTAADMGSEALTHAKKYAPLMGGMALVSGAMAAGTAGGRALFDSAKNAIKKSRSYNKMMEHNPNLKNEDPNRVDAAFNTLFKFNPEFASDPLVAGTFVSNYTDQERMDLGSVKAIVDARKSMTSDRGGGPGFRDFFSVPAITAPYQISEGMRKDEDAPLQRQLLEGNVAGVGLRHQLLEGQVSDMPLNRELLEGKVSDMPLSRELLEDKVKALPYSSEQREMASMKSREDARAANLGALSAERRHDAAIHEFMASRARRAYWEEAKRQGLIDEGQSEGPGEGPMLPGAKEEIKKGRKK